MLTETGNRTKPSKVQSSGSNAETDHFQLKMVGFSANENTTDVIGLHTEPLLLLLFVSPMGAVQSIRQSYHCVSPGAHGDAAPACGSTRRSLERREHAVGGPCATLRG
eukprot:5374530-Pyramimonas_sp.AAC.1